MKYIHGERTFLHEHEKSLLDRAIDQYLQTADRYYNAINSAENAPADIRTKRKKELSNIERHLELQRLNLHSMASIQAQLDAYRETGKNAMKGTRKDVAEKQKALLAEGHHRPDITKLEKFMQAAGKPKPDQRHSAHHIVPGKGKTRFANLARVHMHRFGIRINDPDNGVWLPTYARYTPLWSMPDAKGHLQYHTKNYEQWVRQRVSTKSSEDFIRLELDLIGKILQENKLPPEAR